MIRCDSVTKTFRKNGEEVVSLDRFTADIAEGEFVAVRGPSGSGKTTLLLTIGGMQRPTTGVVHFGGLNLYGLPPIERSRLRADQIGFVFQMFHLVPYLNLLGNVLLAASSKPSDTERKRAAGLLDELGLAGRTNHLPGELSAGERQRLAVARALMNRPKLILADEPTGNLDPENAAEVIRHLVAFHRDGGTVVLVTHGTASEQYAQRILRLNHGRLTAD